MVDTVQNPESEFDRLFELLSEVTEQLDNPDLGYCQRQELRERARTLRYMLLEEKEATNGSR